MSKFWEKVFFVFSYISQGSSYLSPRAYGIMHRMHHAYTDTEKDPHSPSFDKNLIQMMWKTKKFYSNVFHEKIKLEDKFKIGVPEWMSFDNFGESAFSRIAWIVAYVVFYYFFATEWWLWFFLPLNIVMGPFHGAIINWFAHKYGYKNFEQDNTSKNLMPFDIFMMGEGYHNNHHKYSKRPNFAIKWFEIDPVYPFIWLFDKLHIIRLKPVPVSK